MKPRIFREEHYWVCTTGLAIGSGASPLDAYLCWQDSVERWRSTMASFEKQVISQWGVKCART